MLTLAACGADSTNDKLYMEAEETATMSFADEEPMAAPAAASLSMMAGEDAPQRKRMPTEPVDNTSTHQTDKIIKTGGMGIVVADYDKGMNQLRDLVKAQQGYISSENEQRNKYRISNNLTIRVASDGFDALLNEVGTIAKELKYKHVNLQDVGEEYADMEARLKAKKEVEKRYLDVLQQARTVKDILEVERQLGMVRAEIESMEGRLKYYDNKVAYSTINLELSQELEPPAPVRAGFLNKLLKALSGGWTGLLSSIIAVAYLWPFLLLTLGAILGIRYLIKRKRVKA